MSSLLGRLIISTTLLVAIAASLAAQQSAAPDNKVLVLRNKRVLRGDVTRLGDRCIIVLSNGGQIQLAAREITIEAASLDEAYQRLRDSMSAPNQIKGHLELAGWCIREGLYAQANEELQVATRINPNDPQLDRLHRQLEYVTRPKAASKHAQSTPSEPQKPVSAQDLEQIVRSMPKVAVEEFTTSIQPVLLNRCGASRCHDSRSAVGFKLIRPASGDRFWRGMTLRNLHATRAQIDVNNSTASPLLKMAVTPHGGADDPALQEGEVQWESLRLWVSRVSRSVTNRESVAENDAHEPAAFQPDQGARPLSSAAEPVRSNDTLEASVEEDPFDPAVFNEQYLDPMPPDAG